MHTTGKTRPHHPHLQIPGSSTHQAANVSPTPWVPQISDADYNDQDASPSTATPFSQGSRHTFYSSPEPYGAPPPLHPHSHHLRVNANDAHNINDPHSAPARPISFTGSFHDANVASWRFPEPQLHRSISQPRTELPPLPLGIPVQPQLHRFSKSDSGNDFNNLASFARAPSVSSSRGSITPEVSLFVMWQRVDL